MTVSFHFVECGKGWSRWYYGVRVVWRGNEILRLKVLENKKHWSYKLNRRKANG